MRIGIALLVATVVTAGTAAADDEKVCLEAASDNYDEKNLELIESAGVPMPAQSLVLQRRLEEVYCERTAKCYAASLPNDQKASSFDVLFAGCLRDEAKKRYQD